MEIYVTSVNVEILNEYDENELTTVQVSYQRDPVENEIVIETLEVDGKEIEVGSFTMNEIKEMILL